MFNMDGFSKPSHIFLTGDKQIGKSTLVDSITKTTDLSWEGLKSVTQVKGNKRYIYLADAKTLKIEENNLIAVCSKEGALEQYPQVFDNFGVSQLNKANGVQLFIMDEVGFIEDKAPLYKKALSELLKRTDLHVLGTIRYEEDKAWYKEVVLSDNVKTFVIKEANRNNMAPVVNRLLHNVYRA